MQGRLLLKVAILIGIFSYTLFFLGALRVLDKANVGLILLVVLVVTLVFFTLNINSLKSILVQAKKNLFYFTILLSFILVNLIGALGPETSFDALWYHLTIPKIYIEKNEISFIEGGLLYYSAMPKIIDLLYIPALMFGSEINAKIIHFCFGILTAITTYKIANLFVSKKLSYLAAVVFYSNLVVGWMSTTAYIDLGRAFFGSLSIFFYLTYLSTKKTKYLLSASILVGFESVSKLLGISTLVSFTAVLIYEKIKHPVRLLKSLIILTTPTAVLLIPWVIFSLVNTGNAVHPFFSEIYPSGLTFQSFNLLYLIKDTFNLLLFSADPISPIYLMTIPLLVIFFKKMPKAMKALMFIVLINLVIWNFIPQKNSRFIISYLPAMSVLFVWVLSISSKTTKKILYFFLTLILTVNLTYRGVANLKYFPYLFGQQSKEEFLVNNLNFSFGDYYDVNNEVKKQVGEEIVLIYGIHNLYYVDFNYDHESWVSSKKYKYILSSEELKNKREYNLIYKNLTTGTYLYEAN